MANRHRPWTSQIIVVIVAVLAWTASAQSVPFFKPDLADFYQHQKSGSDPARPFGIPALAPNDPPAPLQPGYTNGNWWEDGGGWCCIAAFTNSFYFLDKHGFPGLFDHSNLDPVVGPPFHAGRTWQERMAYAIEDLAIDLFGLTLGPDPDGPLGPRTRSAVEGGVKKTIPEFLQKYGYGPDKLTYSEYFIDGSGVRRSGGASTCGHDVCSPPPASTATTFTSLFDVYQQELLRSEDVVFRIEYPTGTDCAGKAWWCGSYHIVTGAGVERDAAQMRLWFADPNNTFHGADWGHPYTNMDLLPVPDVTDPADIARYYEEAALMADGRTFATGPYAGTTITRVFTTSPRAVPEPSTLLLVVFGCTALGIVAGKRRCRI